ncbi:MAG: amino acid adenylation domain-containing protein, partial [bacterium]|nr:amino acid adenylation domain-containing protein [bacterium]
IAGIIYVPRREKQKNNFARGILQVDRLETPGAEMDNNPLPPGKPSDPAYVIFTSGSTGKPKGCAVTNKNVVRLMENDRFPFELGREEVWIMAHSFCFDFSVWEMYGPLLKGGRLIIPHWDDVRDIPRFHSQLKKHKVTVLNQTPGAFYYLIAEEQRAADKTLDKHLRYVVFGGDKLVPLYLKNWIDIYSPDKIRLINMYGITETTVHVTFHAITREEILSPGQLSPIGKPLPETTVYVFDKQMNLAPIGVTGELYVGGSGVASGYVNNPELSNRRFIENPYKNGEIVYRTGDLGRWKPDGTLAYAGRIDNQVKIRGYRIELGEIENQLLAHKAIGDAVVTAIETTGESERQQSLCAYFVSREELEISELRQHLSRELPTYMIPSYFVPIEKVPLTSNRKVDIKALPDPRIELTSKTYTAPRDEIEEKVVDIWSEILSVGDNMDEATGSTRTSIGIDDNFFELGGDSLKATALVSKIHKLLEVKVPLTEVFKEPTIREFAEVVRQGRTNIYDEILPVETKNYYPQSSAQKRLYFLDQLEEIGTSYNIPAVIKIDGR